jgi:riboflavin transporter FmnP
VTLTGALLRLVALPVIVGGLVLTAVGGIVVLATAQLLRWLLGEE